jgi:hypothetical protein
MTKRSLAIFCAVLSAVWMAVAPAWSQESRGTILGRVTDTSGSVVPGGSIQSQMWRPASP